MSHFLMLRRVVPSGLIRLFLESGRRIKAWSPPVYVVFRDVSKRSLKPHTSTENEIRVWFDTEATGLFDSVASEHGREETEIHEPFV